MLRFNGAWKIDIAYTRKWDTAHALSDQQDRGTRPENVLLCRLAEDELSYMTSLLDAEASSAGSGHCCDEMTFSEIYRVTGIGAGHLSVSFL